MSYVPNCESDVFISYAHIDNEPIFEGQAGWIEVFHRALEVRLRQHLGEEPSVWRDPSLRGNEYFEDTLKHRLLKTALLISVVSPRYLKSEWCQKELEEFCRGAERSGGIRLQDKSRLFKVVKTGVAREDLPVLLQYVLGYEFCTLDQVKRPREYRLPPDPRDEHYQACLNTLEDLAYDLKITLEALRRALATGGTLLQQTQPERTIYLAETTSDLRAKRDDLKRELKQRGLAIFPCEASPENGAQYRKFVASQLTQVQCSVHLLGEFYGPSLEGETQSTVDIQIEQAGIEAAQKGVLRRVLWLPEDLTPKEERQHSYIAKLKHEACNQPNTELLETNIENLKSYLLRKLTEPPKSPTIEKPVGAPLIVYLIHDRSDTRAVNTLRDYLMALGHEVKPSYFEGEEKELREYHQENLVQCDGAIIYYGTASELWVQRKLYDLRKAFGLGRQRPFLAKAVFVSMPSRPGKERFRTQEAMVIKAIKAFSTDALEPFVSRLAPHP